MLTETRNKHFSERLFYVDSLSVNVPFAQPCYNGNTAAAVFKQTDSVYAFSCAYDAMNRFAESKYCSLPFCISPNPKYGCKIYTFKNVYGKYIDKKDVIQLQNTKHYEKDY